MLFANPHQTEPMRKSAIATPYKRRRPYKSDNFPYSGTVVVDVSMNAEKTHEKWSSPPNCPTIVGMAVATTVDSIEARNKLSIMPIVTRMIRLRDMIYLYKTFYVTLRERSLRPKSLRVFLVETLRYAQRDMASGLLAIIHQNKAGIWMDIMMVC